MSFITIFMTNLRRVKWTNVILITVWHSLAVYAFYYLSMHQVSLLTFAWTVVLTFLSGIGLSVGAHRLWAHRSFKARLLLRLLLVVFHSTAMNGPAYSYARDHRQHHKYTDTEADPKNPTRGLFYSHLGWWMLKKNPIVLEHGRKLDHTNLNEDGVLQFEKRFYVPMFLLFGVALPMIIPYYIWSEDVRSCFLLCVVLRITLVLHNFFTVNSLAHYFGSRPYDFRIRPTQNRLVTYLALGEGSHNYHHIFSYDYRSGELRSWEYFNPAAIFIEVACLLGLAHSKKTTSRVVIEEIVEKRGLPAVLEKRHTLLYRILFGAFDYILGVLIGLWCLYPIFIFKAVTGRQILFF